MLDPRRSLLAILCVVTAIGLLQPVAAQQATPTAIAGGAGHLVVADAAAEALHVYDLVDLSLSGTIEGIVVATHAGFLPLPDGNLLFVNDATHELTELAFAEDGAEIVGSAPIPTSISHFAIDPEATMAVVGSSEVGDEITLVDLETFTSESFAIDAGEVGIALGGDPLTVFHRNDEARQVEAYPVAQLSEGDTTPVSTVAIGDFGHGEAISHTRGQLYAATDAGFEVITFDSAGLEIAGTLPWDPEGNRSGRAYFARISPDEQHLITYIADRTLPEADWGDWENDLYIADLERQEVTRTELAPGYVFRFSLSPTTAIFVNQHPDGDYGHVVDTDPASETFGQVTATVPLDLLTNAPEAGAAPWEHESRSTAVTPDGTLGFISHGGDGLISVIDTEAGEVVTRIEVPTSLTGGGAMIAIQDGMPIADTIAR